SGEKAHIEHIPLLQIMDRPYDQRGDVVPKLVIRVTVPDAVARYRGGERSMDVKFEIRFLFFCRKVYRYLPIFEGYDLPFRFLFSRILDGFNLVGKGNATLDFPGFTFRIISYKHIILVPQPM